MAARRAKAKTEVELPVLVFEADLEKETKNTFKFDEEEGENGLVCQTLYLQKSGLGDIVPGRIRVTVEVLSQHEDDGE